MFVSTHLDKYRKPSIYFWKVFENNLNIPIDYSESFYCGDCAGRKCNPTSKLADLKDSDFKFALNIGIKFLTPEEIFMPNNSKLSQRSGYQLPDFNSYSLMLE